MLFLFLTPYYMQVHFYKGNGVQPLIKLLTSINPGIQLRVLEVLAILANNGFSRPSVL